MEENKIEEHRMGSEEIPKLLLSISLPIAISMLVQSLYNIVDSIFVSRISEEALAAVSLAFPVQMFMNAVAVGTSVGVSALLSRYMGQKNTKRANRTGQTGIILALLSGLFFVFVGFFFVPKFIGFQTTDPVVYNHAVTYLRLLCIFNVGIQVQINFERLLQSTGLSFYSMITQIVGALINIIFDPILIFGLGPFPRMGVTGAAVATLGGQMIGALTGLYLNYKKNRDIDIFQKGFKLEADLVKKIYSVGLPTIILIALNSFGVFVINTIVGAFSATAVAAYGIYFKVSSFVFMPVFGLTNGLVPIVAYNYGAGFKERIYEVIKLAMKAAFAFMFLGFLIFQFGTKTMIGFFDPTPEMIKIGTAALKITSVNFLFAGFGIVASSAFQALGNGVLSMILTIIRQLVVLAPVAYLLSLTGRLEMIWWAVPISEFVAFFFAFYFLRLELKKKVDNLAPLQN